MRKKPQQSIFQNGVDNSKIIGSWNLINPNCNFNQELDFMRTDEYTPYVLNVNESKFNTDQFLLNRLIEHQLLFNTLLEILSEICKKALQREDGTSENVKIFFELVQSNKDNMLSKEDIEKCRKYPTIFPADMTKKMTNYRIWLFFKKDFDVDDALISILSNSGNSGKKPKARAKPSAKPKKKTVKGKKKKNKDANDDDDDKGDKEDVSDLEKEKTNIDNGNGRRGTGDDDDEKVNLLEMDVCGMMGKIFSNFLPKYDEKSCEIKKIINPQLCLHASDFKDPQNSLSARMSLANSVIILYDCMKKIGDEMLLPKHQNEDPNIYEKGEQEDHILKIVEILRHYTCNENIVTKDEQSMKFCWTFPFPQNVLRMDISDLSWKIQKLFPVDQKITLNILFNAHRIFGEFLPSRLEIINNDKKNNMQELTDFSNERENIPFHPPKKRFLDKDQMDSINVENPLKNSNNHGNGGSGGDEGDSIEFEKIKDRINKEVLGEDNSKDDVNKSMENLGDKLSSLEVRDKKQNNNNNGGDENEIYEDEFFDSDHGSNFNRGLFLGNNDRERGDNMMMRKGTIVNNNAKTLEELLKGEEGMRDLVRVQKDGSGIMNMGQINLQSVFDDPVNALFSSSSSNDNHKSKKRPFLSEPVFFERETPGKQPITINDENKIWKNILDQFKDIKSMENSPTKIFFIISKLLAKNVFESDSYKKATLEEARKIKRAFQEETINRLINMLDSPNHSDEMKKIFSKMFFFLREDKQWGDDLLDDPKFEGLSLFGCSAIKTFAISEQVHNIHHNHALVFFLITQFFSVYNYSKKGLRSNTILDGDKSIGKTFAIRCAESLLIPCTTNDLTHSTALSEAYDDDRPIEGRISIHDEMPGHFKKDSKQSALMKNILTSDRLSVARLKKNDFGNLVKENFVKSSNAITLLATNESVDKMGGPMLSRFNRFALPDGKRENLTITELEESAKEKNSERESILDKQKEEIHFRQVLHVLINMYIASDIIAAPTMAVTSHVFSVLKDEISARLKQTRSLEMLTETIRVNMIDNAISRLYFDRKNPKKFTFLSLLDIEPFLHDTLEVVLFSIGTAGYFEDNVADIIRKRIQNLLKEVEAHTKQNSSTNEREDILSYHKREPIKNVPKRKFNESRGGGGGGDNHSRFGTGQTPEQSIIKFDLNYVQFPGTVKDFSKRIKNNQPPTQKIPIKINETESVSYGEAPRSMSEDQIQYHIKQLATVSVNCYPQLCSDVTKTGRFRNVKPYYFPDDSRVKRGCYYFDEEERQHIEDRDIEIEIDDENGKNCIRIDPGVTRYNNNGEKYDFKLVQIENNSISFHHSFFDVDNQDLSHLFDEERGGVLSRYLNENATSLFMQIHTTQALHRLLDILHRRLFDSNTRPRNIVPGLIANYSLAPYLLAVFKCVPNNDNPFDIKVNKARSSFTIGEICGFKAKGTRKVKFSLAQLDELLDVSRDQENIENVEENLINTNHLASRANISKTNFAPIKEESTMTVGDFQFESKRKYEINTMDIDDLCIHKRLIELNYIPNQDRIFRLYEYNSSFKEDKEREKVVEDKDKKNKRIYPDFYIIDEINEISRKKAQRIMTRIMTQIKEKRPNLDLLDMLIVSQILNRIVKFHGHDQNSGGKNNRLRELIRIENELAAESVEKYIASFYEEIFSNVNEDTEYKAQRIIMNRKKTQGTATQFFKYKYKSMLREVYNNLFDEDKNSNFAETSSVDKEGNIKNSQSNKNKTKSTSENMIDDDDDENVDFDLFDDGDQDDYPNDEKSDLVRLNDDKRDNESIIPSESENFNKKNQRNNLKSQFISSNQKRSSDKGHSTIPKKDNSSSSSSRIAIPLNKSQIVKIDNHSKKTRKIYNRQRENENSFINTNPRIRENSINDTKRKQKEIQQQQIDDSIMEHLNEANNQSFEENNNNDNNKNNKNSKSSSKSKKHFLSDDLSNSHSSSSDSGSTSKRVKKDTNKK